MVIKIHTESRKMLQSSTQSGFLIGFGHFVKQLSNFVKDTLQPINIETLHPISAFKQRSKGFLSGFSLLC
jgi:hypothetical protein